uniref:RICTOR_N domain-containing protein n=1 Tax=Caenorhabditis japonica TaxID=281687 RepID=A0A8R1EMQ7_CAEJA
MNDFLENFKCSFLCLIRSWPGLFACAAVGPNSSILSSSPFRFLEYLGLGTVTNDNLARIRDSIIDLCCDFVDVPYANKTFNSWEEALLFYKTMHLPDKYKSSLKNDFIIAQNEARLKNDTERRKPTVDLLAAFRVLSQFVLINAQLPLSLARLILAMPDSSSGLKATLLMADMLRQAPSHVPVGWRAPVLSMPTLVQSACESLSQSHAIAAIDGSFDINTMEQYTFLHATNAELVLTRFDKLNQSWIRSASNSSTVLKECDLQLFAPHMSEPLLPAAPAMKKSKSETSFRGGASIKRNTFPEIYETESPGEFEETVLRGKYDKIKLMMMDDTDDYDYSLQMARDTFDEEEENAKKMFVDSNGAFDWNYVEYYVENIEKDGYEKLVKEFSSSTIEDHIKNMFHFFSPAEQEKNRRILDRQHVIVAKSFIKILLRVFPTNDSIRQDYAPILQKYVANFRAVLEERNNPAGYFAPRNLHVNNSMLHFAIIGTFTMTSHGLAILNDVGVLHMV